MIFTCNSFTGHYPVGSAAVVTAETAGEAAEKLNAVLREQGLPGDATANGMKEFDEGVVILCDGDY